MLVDLHLAPGPVDLNPSPLWIDEDSCLCPVRDVGSHLRLEFQSGIASRCDFKNNIGTHTRESRTLGRRQSLPTIAPDPGRVRREQRPVWHAESCRRVKHHAGGSGTVPSLELVGELSVPPPGVAPRGCHDQFPGCAALELIPWISPRELKELAIRQGLGRLQGNRHELLPRRPRLHRKYSACLRLLRARAAMRRV